MRYPDVNRTMESDYFKEWCEDEGLDPEEYESYLRYIEGIEE